MTVKRFAIIGLVLIGFFVFLLPLVALNHPQLPSDVHTPAVLLAGILNRKPKKIGAKDYASGGTVKWTGSELGLYRFRAFILVFTATFNKAGATAFGTLATEAPFNIMRDIRVNGKSLIQKTSARFLRQLSHLVLRGYDATYSAPTATNTNQTIAFTLYLDQELLRSDFPDGTILDLSKGVTNPSLEVDFGTVEHLIAGGDYTTKTITGGTLTVFGELDETPGLKNLAYANRELTFIEKVISSSAQNEYPVDLPLKRSITRMLIGQSDNNEVLLSTLVTATANIRVDVNGKPVWGPYTFQELQRENLGDYKVALGTGYVVVDFLRRQRLADWLDLTDTLDSNDPDRITQAQLIVDVASVANARLGVMIESSVPPHLQKAA